MPLVQTRGAASAQGFGEFAQATAVNYIEDVFSCFLYSGTGASQTITNNIDLSTKGGLVWIKERTSTSNHILTDTLRGVYNYLLSNATSEQQFNTDTLTAFNANGFSVGPSGATSESGQTYASWTFREQAKFFDIVTWTGNATNRTIAHNLGSVPGCIFVKRTDTGGSPWAVYHRSLANTQYLVLNTTAAVATGATWWNSTTPTSAVFSVGTDASVNASGGTYVAYIFAHDAGGFGLTETDNVISCGSFTGTSKVTLGYEPQWLLIKKTSFTSDWYLMDTMRGLYSNAPPYSVDLSANTSSAEQTNGVAIIDATGFTPDFGGDTSIYIAIRRGPMKVPTVGTSVYNGIARTGTGAVANITGAGFPPDLVIAGSRTASYNNGVFDKLRGPLLQMDSQATRAESSTSGSLTSFDMDGFSTALDNNGSYGGTVNKNGQAKINYLFRRAPSFFDEVCWTGITSSDRRISHNLGVAPELIITKMRSAGNNWYTYTATTGINKALELNTTAPATISTGVFGTSPPTSTDFGISESGAVPIYLENNKAVAYLFATCAGVSKVGSYTGNGSTQTIDCGFGAGGVRFVLIKRTDSTGDWYTYDTTRGMTVLTDPYLLMNATAGETATLGSVTTVSTGFALNSTILAAINVSAGSYIFLAIA